VNVGGSVMGAVVDVLLYALQGLQWIVIIAALVSWVNPDPRNPIVRFLRGVTDPPAAAAVAHRRNRPFADLRPAGDLPRLPFSRPARVFHLIRRFSCAHE